MDTPYEGEIESRETLLMYFDAPKMRHLSERPHIWSHKCYYAMGISISKGFAQTVLQAVTFSSFDMTWHRFTHCIATVWPCLHAWMLTKARGARVGFEVCGLALLSRLLTWESATLLVHNGPHQKISALSEPATGTKITLNASFEQISYFKIFVRLRK